MFFTKLNLISPGSIGVYVAGVTVIAINLVNWSNEQIKKDIRMILLDFIDLLYSRINTFLNDLVSNTIGRHKSMWKGRLETLYIYNSSTNVLSHLDVNDPINIFIIPSAWISVNPQIDVINSLCIDLFLLNCAICPVIKTAGIKPAKYPKAGVAIYPRLPPPWKTGR